MKRSALNYKLGCLIGLVASLAVMVLGMLVVNNNNPKVIVAPSPSHVPPTKPVEATIDTSKPTSPAHPLPDIPLSLGTTWVYSSTHYDTFVSGEYGTSNFNSERITATYRITETIAETQIISGFLAAKLVRDRVVITSSGDISDARYDNYLGQNVWTPSYWYVISNTILYRQREINLGGLSSSGPIYIFPLVNHQFWKPLPELPGVTTYVKHSGSLTVPAGSFEECFQITTVFLSGPSLQWFFNGVGIVRQKHDHQGTPFGYEQLLIDFWVGKS
jgi:hypothetical protein